jgi:multidrug resistance efflux pump
MNDPKSILIHHRRYAMFRKYAVPLFALALLSFAVVHVVRAHTTPEKAAPMVVPGRTPFTKTVAGTGLVEAQTQNIAIGSPLSGLVMEVVVEVDQRVKAGTVLFRLDDRALKAELKIREANLSVARAKRDRLAEFPRPEELPAARARLREAEATLTMQKSLLDISRRLAMGRGASREEFVQRQQAYQTAGEQVARARADLELLEAGAWAPDKAVAQAEVEQALAQLKQTRIELDRLQIRAPVDGKVLQVNVHPGEHAAAAPGQALIVLGNVGRLHVRVEIDEHDIPRFRPGAAAQAAPRGNPQVTFPLTFVRVEPYVTPKKTLTNDSGERVDTRVLQVIYAVETRGRALYVGQQLDVSIEAPASQPSR